MLIGLGSSVDAVVKDSAGPQDYYSKKTKAEIAFIKRKETLVSIH